MLDKQDLQLIGELFDSKISGIQSTLEGMNDRLDGIDDRLDGIDNRLGVVENRVDSLEKKLEDTKTYLEKVILEVDRNALEAIRITSEELTKRMDRLEEYYRIRKLEDENQGEMLRMILDHQRRIEILEAKTA